MTDRAPRPPFFIVGCHRSGTTLLRNLLRSHPDLAIPGESHFIPLVYRGYGDPVDDRSARRLARRILGLYWVRRWRLGLLPSQFDDCRSVADIAARLYGEVARREGAARWGDKTPDYVREIPTLAAIFPDARFLHIVRDGRDVALSIGRTSFGPGSVPTAARHWRDHVEAGRRDGPPLGAARYAEIRYEDLVGRPETTMREVCAFLGEPFDERVLAPARYDWRDYPKTWGSRPATNVSESRIVASNAGKWKREMDPGDVEVFEGVAGGLLAELGYETSGSGRQLGRVRRAGHRAADRIRWLGYELSRPNKRLWVSAEGYLKWTRIRARLRSAANPR